MRRNPKEIDLYVLKKVFVSTVLPFEAEFGRSFVPEVVIPLLLEKGKTTVFRSNMHLGSS